MPRVLPPLNAVRAFEAAARHANFVRAGEELSVSAGAIGHQVRLLEQWLGTPLFVRGARSVELTETGRRYYLEVKPLIEAIERASGVIRSAADASEVTVSAMPSFVTCWLMPRLGDFRAEHPDVEVRLLASVPPVDFSRDRVDAAIRLGSGPYPGLESELLLPEAFYSVASPALCRKLARPADALQQTLLHDEYEARIPEQIDWIKWCAAQGLRAAADRLRQGLRFSHTYLTLEAAASGQGIAVASDVLAGNAVRLRRLAIAPGPPVPGPYRYHLLSTRAALARPQVRVFCDWLRAQARLWLERDWARPA